MSLCADPFEYAARAFEAPTRRWPSPGALARHVTPDTVQTPALDLIDQALTQVIDQPDGRLIITMPPQEGKSTRVAKHFPVWALTQNPDLRIVTASYGQALANRNGRAIRNTITTHPDLGLRIAPDNGSVSEWTINGRDGGVLSVGVGAGVTGRPADMLIIDDPVKDRKEADSETFRENVWQWWTDSASTRLAPGAPVIVILTRWHEDDLAGKLLAAEDGHLWTVLNIPAQADHNPDKGETDPLDREVGEFMESARGRTIAQWAAIKVRSGTRTWASLYQGRPSPAEGNMFDRAWWREYGHPMWMVREDGSYWTEGFDEVMASWDLTFKKTTGSDFVCGQVWARRGADAYLLDQVHGRMNFPDTVAAVRQLSARWPQAVLKLIEDKANGPAVIASLNRQVPGIVPEEPQGGKEARAAAVTPLIQAGNVWLPAPEMCPWVTDLIEEAAGFPTAKHDDRVDALTQALNRLILQPLLAGQIFTIDDFDDEVADYGAYVP